MLPTTALFSVLALLAGTNAATKDQWRSRSVYQLLTDRFAPPTPDKQCDIRSYCGGSWRTLIDKLDYIQGMGFDAVWISPTGLGLEGYTKWGENYHGFWSVDPFAINPHFGTTDDLKALSAALHARGMYLMVDIAVNHLAATDTDISDSALAAKSDGKLLFKEQEDFHPACSITWGNQQSEQTCWLAQDGVALMDLRTEDANVADVLKQKFAAYMQEYGIDGARVDASKHMTKSFQHDFCTGANTFCIGEVYDDSTAVPASYTKSDGIDSVFGFGMMWGAVDVFAKGKRMSALSRRARETSMYGDATLIGAILDNHDLPRINSLTQDKSNVYNAMALQFLFGGIPTMYYGLEQDISFGASDPENRAPLWQYGGLRTDTESYKRITRLNLIRKKLGELGGFHEVVGEVVGETNEDIAFERNGALLVLTKRGAGQGGEWTMSKAGFKANAKLVDLLSCSTAIAGGDGSLNVKFNNGLPFFYVTEEVAGDTGICGQANTKIAVSSSTSSASAFASTSTSTPSSSVSASTSASSSPEPVPALGAEVLPPPPAVDGNATPPATTEAAGNTDGSQPQVSNPVQPSPIDTHSPGQAQTPPPAGEEVKEGAMPNPPAQANGSVSSAVPIPNGGGPVNDGGAVVVVTPGSGNGSGGVSTFSTGPAQSSVARPLPAGQATGKPGGSPSTSGSTEHLQLKQMSALFVPIGTVILVGLVST